jgi:hypothetical protein
VLVPGSYAFWSTREAPVDKEAAADVILRREETAATRSLANTAKVMTERPLLLRLKELHALKEMAQKVREVRLVVGAAGLGPMSGLLPTGFLAEARPGGAPGAGRGEA